MNDIHLAYPAVLIALPLFYLALALSKRRVATPTMAEAGLVSSLPRSPRQALRPIVVHLLTFMTVAGICTGAARPFRVLHEQLSIRRNIMVVVDVSQSMQAADIKADLGRVSRIEAVKTVVQRFIQQRSQDRIGLVIFGGVAYLQSPLTSDHQFILDLVATLQPGFAGDGTAIGEGLGVALKRIRELPADTRAVILMTDGVNNAGRVDPRTAAKVAADLGIKVHTIGIGGTGADTQSSGGIFQLVTPQAEFDEALLEQIAKTTDGVYFNAGSINQLQGIYDEIDALLTTEEQDDPRRVLEELYPRAAILALITGSLLALLLATVFRRQGGALL